MPQMFGNLSIRFKLLGVTGVTAASGDRTRAGAERRAAAVAGPAVAAVHER
jgi:hypothetical protein